MRDAVTDADLVHATLGGDRDAFAELYHRRGRLIRALCFDATGDMDLAADLAQETFLRAYRRLHTLRRPERFTAWLVGVCRQVCREARRLKHRNQRRLFAASDRTRQIEAASPASTDLLDLRRMLHGATAGGARNAMTLTNTERLALHAYYLQGCSVEEARAAAGLSRSGFYRALSSAVARLRAAFGDEESLHARTSNTRRTRAVGDGVARASES